MNRLLHFINKKIQLQIPVWIFLLLPFIAYLIWEYFWYTRVGLVVIKWHTHFVQYAYVWIIGVFIFQVLYRKGYSERAKNLFLLFTSLTVALSIIEIALQITGTMKTYMEKVSGEYSSPYKSLDLDYYHAWKPNKPHYIKKPEYSFLFPTNSFGLPDVEWPLAKKKNEKRLMALGDSFTEGDGAPYDSSYVALIRQKLWVGGDSFYVMNAGVCGSDPFHNYIFLKNRLLIYKPDIVIQVLATNDMNTDIIFRGGMERFQKEGTQKFTSPPWWEPIYAVSYISRIFFKMAGYNELLHKKDLTDAEIAKLNLQVKGLFRSYIALCHKQKIQLFIVLRPDKGEIENNKYQYDFSPILDSLKSDEKVRVLDLLPVYRAYIQKNKTEVFDYFWKTDGHHNSKGYEMMAQCIYDYLKTSMADSLLLQSKQ